MNPADSHRAFMYGSHPVLTVIGAVVSAVAAVWAAGGALLLPNFAWRRWTVWRAQIASTREVEAAEAAAKAQRAIDFEAQRQRENEAFRDCESVQQEAEAQIAGEAAWVVGCFEALLAYEASQLEGDQ